MSRVGDSDLGRPYVQFQSRSCCPCSSGHKARADTIHTLHAEQAARTAGKCVSRDRRWAWYGVSPIELSESRGYRGRRPGGSYGWPRGRVVIPRKHLYGERGEIDMIRNACMGEDAGIRRAMGNRRSAATHCMRQDHVLGPQRLRLRPIGSGLFQRVG